MNRKLAILMAILFMLTQFVNAKESDMVVNKQHKKDADIHIIIEGKTTKDGESKSFKREYDDLEEFMKDMPELKEEFDMDFWCRPHKFHMGEDFLMPKAIKKFKFNLFPGKHSEHHKRTWLGIQMQELSKKLSKHFGIKEGVIVSKVIDSSPAKKAGIQAGDVITKINNVVIEDEESLVDEIQSKKPGEKVSVTLIRDGKQLTLEVILARFGTESTEKESSTLGIKVKQTEETVKITEIEDNSVAETNDLEVGDKILQIERISIKSERDFIDTMEKFKNKDSMLFYIERDDSRFFISVEK